MAKALATVIALAFALSGCAGSLEAARPPRAAASVSPERVEHCDSLDTEHRVESGLAKAFALAGGTAGLSTIPMQDVEGDRALAIGALASAAVAAGLQVAADLSATAWARECAK